MKPYYQDNLIILYNCDCLEGLKELPDESVDCLVTDPPYGISFMGKDWDRALPDKDIWRECFRILKSGSFAFVMSIPRADCLSRMIISLEDAGFEVNFTPIFWAYASGFPKAQNISKAVDKRLGAKREVVGRSKRIIAKNPQATDYQGTQTFAETAEGREASKWLTESTSPQAKALDGSYGGFQPKPAVEVIIVAMKPLSEKTFVDQALKNRHGISWLDDGRIPYESEGDKEGARFGTSDGFKKFAEYPEGKDTEGIYKQMLSSSKGRFPANLLVSDDVLNTGCDKGTKPHQVFSSIDKYEGYGSITKKQGEVVNYGDSGSFSRYFDLDKWAQKTFPFLIVPKASKGEKNRYLDSPNKKSIREEEGNPDNWDLSEGKVRARMVTKPHSNYHPTVKPLKLMSYLIVLGSREGDIVLDPFGGSGTTLYSCQITGRKCIGMEINEKYCEIVSGRCRQMAMDFYPEKLEPLFPTLKAHCLD